MGFYGVCAMRGFGFRPCSLVVCVSKLFQRLSWSSTSVRCVRLCGAASSFLVLSSVDGHALMEVRDDYECVLALLCT